MRYLTVGGKGFKPVNDLKCRILPWLMVFIVVTNIVNFFRRPWQYHLMTSLCDGTGCGNLKFVLLLIQLYIWIIQTLVIVLAFTILFIIIRIALNVGVRAT